MTGGLGNLGPWWVKALFSAGASIAVVDLPGLAVPANLIKHDGVKVFSADITDLESLKSAHAVISRQMGKIDILVNNAGIDASPRKTEGKAEDKSSQIIRYRKMWQVNVQGMVNCIEEFSSDMQKSGGSIINIGSLYLERSPFTGLYSHLGFDKPWAYGSTKAAVHQLTRHFATRLAKYKIRVNTLSPGGVEAGQDKKFIEKYSARVPLGRMAQRETDLAGPLVFLASQASCYVTGINLQVNGGYTAW